MTCYRVCNDIGGVYSSVAGRTRGVRVPSLALLRKQAALSQAELAEQAGVARITISRLEQGANARYDTIDKLAEALGTTRFRLTKRPRQASRAKGGRAVSQG